MHNTTILKEKQLHYGAILFNHAHAPQFLLELCLNYQNNVDFFLSKKYTLNGNYLELIIMITVKDFRYTLEKIARTSGARAKKLTSILQWKARGGSHSKLPRMNVDVLYTNVVSQMFTDIFTT
jgi:hypothetical protein